MPKVLYVVVAATIALVGFGLAQVSEGLGVVFVAPAMALWVALSVLRQGSGRGPDRRC